MVCLKGVLAAFAMVSMIIMGCSCVSSVAADEDELSFTIADEELQFSASMAISMDWDSDMDISEGEVASISYTPSSSYGSASILLPFSELVEYLMLELDDQVVEIPVPGTPIGEVSISLSQTVTGIPSSVASVDVVIQASLSVDSISCTSGSEDVLTDISDLRWTSWQEKSISVDIADAREASITTTFQYAISIGVVVTALDDLLEIELLPQTEIGGVVGTPSIESHVVVDQNLLSQYMLPAVILIILSIVIAAIIIKLKIRGKKTT